MSIRLFTVLSDRLSLKPPKYVIMAIAVILTIEERDDGVFLYHWDANGGCIGDTWHLNVEDAKKQARDEYNVPEQDWKNIPSGIEDISALLP